MFRHGAGLSGSVQRTCLLLGLTDTQVQALNNAGVNTFATFAYCTSYQPGQISDKPLTDFLSDNFGGPLTAGCAAACRRLFFESHTLSLDDLKSRAERSESSEARTLPLSEKMDRITRQRGRLAGVCFTPATEPSHSLIDKVCQQLEDGFVSYIEPSKCNSRQDETLQHKTDQNLTMDSSGSIRFSKKPKLDDISISGEHQLRMALQRRSLAYDLAGIATFQTLEAWSQHLFEKLNEPAPPGYKSVTIEQALSADKALWVKVSEETRAKLAGAAGSPKPFDVAWDRLMHHPDVILFLMPLQQQIPRAAAPANSGFQQQQGQSSWGGKGKDKNSKGKAKGKGIQIPDNCTIIVTDSSGSTKTLCKKFQLGYCKAKIKAGKRCMNGYHLCWRKNCHKPHPGNECPI